MPLPDYIDNSRYKLQTILKTLIKDENQIILDIATGFFRIEAWVRLEAAMNQLTSLRLLLGRDPIIRPAESDRTQLCYESKFKGAIIMDEIVAKLAGVGLPAVILLITMASTGLAGAAAITAALAMLGPGGMVGGIVLLGIIGLASDALTKYGLTALLQGIYQERKAKGESLYNLSREIDGLPITRELKLIIKEHIGGI